MKTLALLEVGGLEGLVFFIILIILGVASFVSLIVTVFIKLIYESGGKRKFSNKQFWQTMLISLLICGLISGALCGGM